MQRSASVTDARRVSDPGTIPPETWPDGVDTWPPGAAWGPWGHDPHVHPYAHLLYAASGTCTIVGPGGEHVVDAAHAVWVPRETPHSARFDADFSPVVLEASTGARGPVRTIAVTGHQRALLLAAQRDPDGVAALLADLVGYDARRPLAAAAYGRGAGHGGGALTARVTQALTDDPADARTLEDWARELHVSAVTIRRAFVVETGVPFSRWRTERRLDAAVELLGAGEPVTAVAHAVGLSHNGLIAACRRHLGRPPSSLRAAVATDAR